MSFVLGFLPTALKGSSLEPAAGFIGYRLCRRPLGPEAWMTGCLDAWVLGCLAAGVPVACQMSHLAFPCGREHQFEGQGGVGGLEVCRAEIPCGVLRHGSVTPLRWSNKGFLQSGMLGCLDAWMPRGVSALEGCGDAGLEGIGDCSCNVARSSSGRGRRIFFIT